LLVYDTETILSKVSKIYHSERINRNIQILHVNYNTLCISKWNTRKTERTQKNLTEKNATIHQLLNHKHSKISNAIMKSQ